jgi:TatD DNase family protein
MEVRYVDVHAHIGEDIFDKDRETILDQCKQKGILVIDCGGKKDSNRKLLKLIKKFENLKSCLGIYPIEATEMSDKDFADELKFIEENKKYIVGLGENGLDFYWIKDEHKRRLQMDRFNEIIWLANKLKLPLNVHTRDATKESIAMLVKGAHVPVILHAFAGEIEDTNFAVKHGFFFSIPPNVIYNEKRQKLVAMIPITSLLSETDCPYLGPTKERNDPRNIPLVIEKIAEIKKLEVETVRMQLLENAKRIFKLD